MFPGFNPGLRRMSSSLNPPSGAVHIHYKYTYLSGNQLIYGKLFFSLRQMTPLHVAAEKARIGTLKYLIDQNAEVNFQAQNGVNISYSVCKILQHHTSY